MSGGVTYRRANTPNLSNKDGLRKQIENPRARTAKTRFFRMWECLVGREEGRGGRRVSGGAYGPHTMCWRGPRAAAPPCGVVALWVPLATLWYSQIPLRKIGILT